MRKTVLMLLLSFAVVCSFAQTGDSLTFYFDRDWAICDSAEAVYYRKAMYWDEKGEPQTVYYKDQICSFPGGQEELMKYLSKEMNYPSRLREMGVQGKVLVSFNVDREGNISKITIRRSSNEAFSKEVIRVVSQMPRWDPAISHN